VPIRDTDDLKASDDFRPVSDARNYINPRTMMGIHEHVCLKVKLFFYVY
jgi:hypothetical protein